MPGLVVGIPMTRNRPMLIGSVFPPAPVNPQNLGDTMKSSTRDKVEGTANQVKGKVKEQTGKAVGNPNLRDEGLADQAAGKVQKKAGDVKKVFDR